MKKLRILVASLSLAAVCLMFADSASAQTAKPKGKAWPAPEAAVKVKNPVKADEASVKEGKELYATNCKSCHGAKGKGDGTKAEKIEISCGDFSAKEMAKITDGELYWKTTEGRKPMPSFKEKMSDNERWAVVNYMRTLQDK